jgi:hypothetical protein
MSYGQGCRRRGCGPPRSWYCHTGPTSVSRQKMRTPERARRRTLPSSPPDTPPLTSAALKSQAASRWLVDQGAKEVDGNGGYPHFGVGSHKHQRSHVLHPTDSAESERAAASPEQASAHNVGRASRGRSPRPNATSGRARCSFSVFSCKDSFRQAREKPTQPITGAIGCARFNNSVIAASVSALS